MKILEESVWWKFTCTSCGSKLEAEPNDVKVGYFNGSYCENGDREYYVECPKCGKKAFVPDGKLTAKIMDIADSK